LSQREAGPRSEGPHIANLPDDGRGRTFVDCVMLWDEYRHPMPRVSPRLEKITGGKSGFESYPTPDKRSLGLGSDSKGGMGGKGCGRDSRTYALPCGSVRVPLTTRE